MKIIELASYPKCGNTWLRHLLSKHFELNIHNDIPDFHQRHDETKSFIKEVRVQGKKFGFYKSHIPNIRSINPDEIVVIYRHPLDVFLSSMNYFYINNWKDKYRNGNIKTVEALKESGELDYYFEQFLEEVGSGYFEGLLGDKSHYFNYLEHVRELPNVHVLKYESLFDGRNEFFDNFFSELLQTKVTCSDSLFSDVDVKTKGSGERFYWKSRKKNYESFLSDSQVQLFNKKYQDELIRYGY
tara:strand:+ start:798 stop:1523 length:726 start_codon:yes stop_codon:yes gene_type:complete